MTTTCSAKSPAVSLSINCKHSLDGGTEGNAFQTPDPYDSSLLGFYKRRCTTMSLSSTSGGLNHIWSPPPTPRAKYSVGRRFFVFEEDELADLMLPDLGKLIDPITPTSTSTACVSATTAAAAAAVVPGLLSSSAVDGTEGPHKEEEQPVRLSPQFQPPTGSRYNDSFDIILPMARSNHHPTPNKLMTLLPKVKEELNEEEQEEANDMDLMPPPAATLPSSSKQQDQTKTSSQESLLPTTATATKDHKSEAHHDHHHRSHRMVMMMMGRTTTDDDVVTSSSSSSSSAPWTTVLPAAKAPPQQRAGTEYARCA